MPLQTKEELLVGYLMKTLNMKPEHMIAMIALIITDLASYSYTILSRLLIVTHNVLDLT